MIHEKKLEPKARRYASSVILALIGASGARSLGWHEAKGLIEAAYYNGFQSGVVWQKEAAEPRMKSRRR